MAASGHQQLDTSGFPTPPWLHLVGQLPKVTSRKVKLALPCIGLDALGWGLREAGWESYEVTYAYDIDESLTPALRQLHGDQVSSFHLGPDGDLLKVDVRTWSRVDFVVTGPPCPPFSTIGPRLTDPREDPRERAFKKVTECLVHQGSLGCWGFVLETVPGIEKQVAPIIWTLGCPTCTRRHQCLPSECGRCKVLTTCHRIDVACMWLACTEVPGSLHHHPPHRGV